jgi:type III restriction enzyme
MSDIKNLYDELDGRAYKLKIPFPEIPEYISANLRYPFFDWQKDAFENLIKYNAIKEKENNNQPTHLMFNMATGTGKTLVMASCILHYYKQGYRKFIFFVNQKNIIYKTENNFIDSNHNKYLFANKIVIDNETVNIKKVETFSKNNEGVEIKFTTIQQLYNDIHIQKENQVTLDDLIKQDIVMLADEAHHLNTDTKKLQSEEVFFTELNDKSSSEEIEKKGWEHTVIELLLNRNSKQESNKNVLLEFTATLDKSNKKVTDKYLDKIVYKYGLKEFLTAGFTKEINLLSSTLVKRERILQAILFSWYRHKIALKNNLPNWKPVVLFRSKTIDESKVDFEDFLVMVKNLQVSDFDFLDSIEGKFTQGLELYEQGKSRVLELVRFIKKEKINIYEIITFIKDNFVERNCIITNSKSNKAKTIENIDQDTDKLLNNLEDKNNHIRAIFTVNRLTEGWDVLNLFDIVRLYSGRDEGKDKKGNRVAGKGTVSEIQLIGRGVRYYPFKYQNEIRNKRKFDQNLDNEMRVLEELYYHCDSDHRYIDELKRELKNVDLIDDGRIEKRFKIKPEFAGSDFFKDVKIWKNEQIDNPQRKQKTLDYLLGNLNFEYELKSFRIKEQEINFDNEDLDKERLNIISLNKKTIIVAIKDFDKHIFYKAVNIKSKQSNSLLRFELLQKELDIESIEDFRTSIIGDFKIKITGTGDFLFDNINNEEKLKALLEALDIIFNELKQNIDPYTNTEFTSFNLSQFFGEEIRKKVKKDIDSQTLEDELKHEDWYVVDQFYGTSEEKGLIEFIKNTIVNLQNKYEEVYLLRNEEQYKIYDSKGRGFQPDFILFLKDKTNLHYQVFIEPKGDNLLEKDDWKNDLLIEITKKYSNNKILKIESKEYNLIGLPLFNLKNKGKFEVEYEKLI